MRTAISHCHRFFERSTRWIAIAISLVLGAPSVSHGASGEFFTPLRAGQFEPFDNLPAYHIRVYVKTLFATYKSLCPDTAPKYEQPWDLAAYLMTPADSSHGSDKSLYSILNTQRDKVLFARLDGASDIKWMVQQSGCPASVHQDWMTQARKLMSDPKLAGPLPGAGEACNAHRTRDDDCKCFATAFDMQSSPLRRRQFLEALSPLQGLQQTLQDSDFAIRVEYKCATTPNFFRAELTTPVPPHANFPDDRYRLIEGIYRVRLRPGMPDVLDRGTYSITRTDNWRYALKWQKGVSMRMLNGILSSDGKELKVYGGGPQPSVYGVLADGRLRGLEANNQLDLVPASAEPAEPIRNGPGRSTESAKNPHGKASAQQCIRLQRDIDRFKGDPRRAQGLAILEQRYAQWCAGE